MGNSIDKVYSYSPVWLQNIGISAFGYKWRQRRFGGIFKQELNLFKNRESYTHQQWNDFQTIQLRKLLVHAYETVPFYREKYSRYGFNVEHFKKFELFDLPKIPFLSKNELRQFGVSSLVSSKGEAGGTFYSSSGSTGTPVKILYSHAFHQRISAAMEARVRNWAGVDYNTPRGMIGGRKVIPAGIDKPPYYRYNLFEKQTYFSAYHISEKNALNYLEGIIKNKVRYMTGYAMSNYLLAAILEELGVKSLGLDAVITSSEKLSKEMRKTFKNVYNCKVFDSYSGVENCALISESQAGNLLISPDVGIVETINNNEQTVNTAGEFEIACTGLLNYDQPLIRYRIGDCITAGLGGKNISGNSFPVVDSISGRVEDVITTSDGRKMVRFHSIFVDLEGVVEAQVIQHNFELYTVKVISNNNYSKTDAEKIINRMRRQLGNVKVNIIKVDKIERSKSGKFKAVISEIN